MVAPFKTGDSRETMAFEGVVLCISVLLEILLSLASELVVERVS